MRKNGKQLNIAMLGHKRIPSREGGVEIVVEELSTRIVAQHHSVTCFNRSGHHVSGREYDTKRLTSYKGVSLEYVPTVNRKGLAALTSSVFGAIRAALGKFDVVHFHAEGPCAAMWIPKLFGKRCIATIHGIDWMRAKWGGFASRYIRFGEQIAAKYADEVIVLSKGVQNYFREAYGRETVFIPNGVTRPEPRAAELIQERFGLAFGSYVLFLGRLVPEKGIAYLVDAFKAVRTDKKLVIAGGSSDTEAFSNALKDKALGDDRIIFTGFVQGQLLDELYSNAYLYCLPSDLEGMPLSLLEAMSYGNCCLVSDIPECTEVVEDKAAVFQRGNVADLTRELQLLCDDEGLTMAYRKEAADFILRKYNWDDVVQQTLELYRGQPKAVSADNDTADKKRYRGVS